MVLSPPWLLLIYWLCVASCFLEVKIRRVFIHREPFIIHFLAPLFQYLCIYVAVGTTLALYKDADYVKNPRTGEILESCMDRICQNILTNLAPGNVDKHTRILYCEY